MNAFGDTVQIVLQRWRNVARVKGRFIGIANDGTEGIVACDNDKAFIANILDIKGIILTRVNEI